MDSKQQLRITIVIHAQLRTEKAFFACYSVDTHQNQ